MERKGRYQPRRGVINTAARKADQEMLEAFKASVIPEDALTPVSVLPVRSVPISAETSAAALKPPVMLTKPKLTPKPKVTASAPPKPIEKAAESVDRGNRFDSYLDTIYGEPEHREGETEERYKRKYDERMMKLIEKKLRYTEKKNKDPLLTQYEVAQKDFEEKGHYLLETNVFIPTTRRAFYPFIQRTYNQTPGSDIISFRLPFADPEAPLDTEACEKLFKSGKDRVEAFLYQRFVKEYLRQSSPYRGLLVYHGLGSGKTCSAIAAAEALYGVANKRVIVMSPMSLRGNFLKEITFCGFRHFSLNNHWIKIEAEDFSTTIELYAKSVLSLSERFISALKEKSKPIWIPDFTKPPNYIEIASEEKDWIRAQINETIDNRITFISYNGISGEKLLEYACERTTTGKTIFDDAVIVVDEIHNLINLMQGTIIPFLQEKQGVEITTDIQTAEAMKTTEERKSRRGKKRRIPVEPITVDPWLPKLCPRGAEDEDAESLGKYERAVLFYKLLVGARNSKIIGLSGTPIINFPEELAILMNVLGGYIHAFECMIPTSEKVEQLEKILNEDPRTDLVRISIRDRGYLVQVSIFQEGYVKVLGVDKMFEGIKHNAEAQESIREVYLRLSEKAKKLGVPLGEPIYRAYSRLPPDGTIFRPLFVDTTSDTIINQILLKKRLTGLISYYKGSKEEFMPKVISDEEVKTTMSDFMLEKYAEARKMEIEQEAGKKETGGDLFAIMETLAQPTGASNYRFRSRVICNFVFPESIERPYPRSQRRIDKEVKAVEEDIEVAERQSEYEANVDELELAALQEQAKEEKAERKRRRKEDKAIRKAAEAEVEETKPKRSIKVLRVAPSVSEPVAAPVTKRSIKVVRTTKGGDPPEDGEGEEETPAEEETAADEKEAEEEEAEEEADEEAEEEAEEEEAEEEAEEEEAEEEEAEEEEAEEEEAEEEEAEEEEAEEEEAEEEEEEETKESPSLLNTASEAVSEGLEAVVEAAVGPTAKVIVDEDDQIKAAMATLRARKDEFLKLDGPSPINSLKNFSPKLDIILRKTSESPGPVLIYSQFVEVEGLGVMGIALEANGYEEIRIGRSKAGHMYLTKESKKSIIKGPGGANRYITFSGKGSKEQRAAALAIFNGHFSILPEDIQEVFLRYDKSVADPTKTYAALGNRHGEICKVIGISGAGAEGINLKCVRQVHILEPFWNKVRTDQLKGRAVRICSHADLPPDERNVSIYTYVMVFSPEQLSGTIMTGAVAEGSKVDFTILTKDNKETSDEHVYNISRRKDAINQALLKVMKESAVDCTMNRADNESDISCFRTIETNTMKPMFLPDIREDQIETEADIRATREETTEPTLDTLDKEMTRRLPARATKLVRAVEFDLGQGSKIYTLRQDTTNSDRFFFYTESDVHQRRRLGEMMKDPISDGYTDLTVYDAPISEEE